MGLHKITEDAICNSPSLGISLAALVLVGFLAPFIVITFHFGVAYGLLYFVSLMGV